MTVLVEARGVTRRYPLNRKSLFGARPMLTAVDEVSFTLHKGRSLGVVGESGSGKSTLARMVMALERPDAGTILFEGEDLFALSDEALRQRRRHFQMVFQDPFGSLDPRMTVGRIIAEPLEVAEPELERSARTRASAAMLASVSLPAEAMDKLSARVFRRSAPAHRACPRADHRTALVVADEPVSALDVSVQAQVLNLMADLKAGARPDLSVHQPQSRRGRACRRRCAGALSRTCGRAGADEATCSILRRPSLYARRSSMPCRASFAEDRCWHDAPALRQHGGRKVACHLVG
jgi:ABC-type microcin C transport system duplicated ATPase subunit YejF